MNKQNDVGGAGHYFDPSTAEVPPVGHPMQKLGEYLSELLDEAEWATAEQYLLAAWALASPAAVGWQPDLSYGKHAKEAWVIMFEDVDVSPEVFIGEGAEAAARHRFKANLLNWNCHLLCTAPPAIAKQSEVGHDSSE